MQKIIQGERRTVPEDSPETSTVLITGARGFIGRAVMKSLKHEGCPVLGIDRADSAESVGGQIAMDITDGERLRRLFQGRAIAGIIHLAAILPTAAQRDPVCATEVNVRGSLNVLEMARQFGVRRVVFGSSLSVYGTCPADRVVSELDRAAPEDLYGAAKVYVEQLGAAYRERYGVEFVSLRIGRVVGPGAQSSTSAWRSEIFELLSAKSKTEIAMPYVASERILVVHVEHVAKMLITLLRAPELRHSVYNACCESVMVGDLKQHVEGLNSNLRVTLGDAAAAGNPRLIDCSRFSGEFDFKIPSIFEQLQTAAGGDAP
ncbi:MAG TPA: NAD(P)-dependent oxidoreductase [Candidatus Sulfotelmatobacter sp.]|nr:NAD(P)-dependent oxidoreductase [Candidatus Sulfotelmatobacter sp.]